MALVNPTNLLLPQPLPSKPRRHRRPPPTMATAATSSSSGADRAALLKAFDESRTGVRGLVESGVSSVPSLFVHPNPHAAPAPTGISIPIVDLSLPAPLAAAAAVAAALDWGFFHLVNHGLFPPAHPSRALAAVRAFHEQPPTERAAFYGRGLAGGVSYSSNVDLFRSAAASWRDTIQVALGPTRPDPARIPPVCRDQILEWDEHATAVGRAVLGLLSEGLGLAGTRLAETMCLERKVMVCHYYPPCPEPERTMGTVAHTDPGVLTVLVQDDVGGLQVKRAGEDGESYWVDVKPVPGALVINVGDLLQIMSNDEYKSVEHRVVINSREDARVSIAIFFNPGKQGDSDLYGPLPELLSQENPPKYRNFTISEFMRAFFSRELGMEGDTNDADELTPLQKHVAFFDRDKDGIIYPWETYIGFRAIGFGFFESTLFMLMINGLLSSKTSPGPFPSLVFPVYVKNVQNGKHGSDTGAYDAQGRFVPEKFEEIFKKHAKTNPNALTSDEMEEMLYANRKRNDFLGWIGSFFEWRLLYSIGKDEDGLLQKETVRGVYDGSLFEQLEKKRREHLLKTKA